MKTLTDTDSEIVEVAIPGFDQFRVNQDGVTHFVAYEENGEMAAVPWIAVVRGQHVWKQFPARMAVITYRQNDVHDVHEEARETVDYPH